MTTDLTPAGSAAVRLAADVVRLKRERDRARGIAVALEAENARLRAVWLWVWEGPGSADYGDHVGYTFAEDQHLADLAEKVEDFYVKAGIDWPQSDEVRAALEVQP